MAYTAAVPSTIVSAIAVIAAAATTMMILAAMGGVLHNIFRAKGCKMFILMMNV
jgi:hypothetical protein